MTNYYNIFPSYENGIYERGENNYYVIKIKDIEAQSYTDPSTVSLSIYNNCGEELVSNAAMTKSDTGIYYYNYLIPADARFGEYEIKVTASNVTDTISTIYKDKFYVLPWNAIYEVRRYSGITSEKSISNHDIAAIIWEAYKEALDCVYVAHHNETPKCDPDTGAWFNGTNTTFATPYPLIADRYGDGTVTGYGEISCLTDISGWWKDSDGDCHKLKITVNEAHCGNITVTQLDGNPIPSSMKWVHLDYWTEWKTYDETLFRLAVAYLAAHKCIIRFQELDKATLADLYSNREMITQHLDRMLNEYEKTMKKIRRPIVGGAMKPGDS